MSYNRQNDDMMGPDQVRMNLPQMDMGASRGVNNYNNNSNRPSMNGGGGSILDSKPALVGPFGNHYSIDSTAGSIAGTNTGIGNFGELDTKSVSSTPSKISKFTYSGE